MFWLRNRKLIRPTWRHAICLLLIALGAPSEGRSQPLDRIAVIYPQTAQPYNAVFSAIVDGIESELGRERLATRAVQDNDTAAALRDWIAQLQPAAVITLGRLPYQRFTALESTYPYVVGALDAGPDTHPGIAGVSLSAEPDLILERLSRLSPATQRILVVYDPRRDQWLIDRAQNAARQRGLVVEAYQATNLREATQHFVNIFSYANPRVDALWLTTNTELVNDNNLPTIIERSWNRRMVVFSNNLEHANRGVLFAVFPDPEGLGHRLATLAISRADDPSQAAEMLPLADVRDALNVRVSNHLDLSVPAHVSADFDLLFGTR